MLQLPPNPTHLRLPLDWELRAAASIGFSFPPIGWREEDCKTCWGTKIVRTWEGAPLDSKVVEFPCNCVDQMLLTRHLGMRGIGHRLRTKGMKDLRWVKPAVLARLAEWNDNPIVRARHTTGIAIVGSSEGKTLIATILQRMLIVHGLDAFLLPTPLFVADGALNNRKHAAYEDAQEFWNTSIRSAPVLVIDRVDGAAMANDWVKVRIDNLIRYRIDNGMMTVLTATSMTNVEGALPLGSDLSEHFDTIDVISEPYPADEIAKAEIEHRITRPVVLL